MAFTKDIGINDFYKLYVEIAKRRNIPYKSYKEYSTILKLANKKLRDKIIYNSDTATLPYRLGTLSIRKFQNHYSENNKKNWKVNYKASKEQGITIYHAEDYGYKWKWNKANCIVKGRKWYTFKPCRTASRLIADAINNKHLDFYN